MHVLIMALPCPSHQRYCVSLVCPQLPLEGNDGQQTLAGQRAPHVLQNDRVDLQRVIGEELVTGAFA